ncbi:EF-hand calcium-binding domain-containing protein 4B-like isoform X3 [Mytilus californianus]|nr:EF-hand calcium-binding domain-containing protein 4B-like isoform X3 [Mytilus californianus]XP_052066842.1 EF-hand calcium-binding domain-containing protein 4B-like isoform X3 [Mytilus californianus]XP_052066844.1 EF-hand calcium-binding domain-containing protein 4B-like isoform X3 [Mytilus californianus]
MGDSTMEGDDTLENVYEGEERQEEEKQFTDMMENIGAKSLFDDENTIRHLWMKIRRDEPEMVGNFEEFLYKTSTDLRKTKADFDTLENALKSKSSAHDEEVRKLYEEMEYQIKKEKERILSEEQLKERNVRETLERDLEEKDKQLQELLNRHSEMEKKLEVLNLVETETKQENEKLAKDKEELEDMLMKSQVGLEDSKMYIDQLRHQQKKEKQDRARSAIKLTESIALERESLVKQLDTLKDVNKKLRDDKDEAEIRRDLTSNPETDDPEQILEAEAGRSSPRKKELFKQGSILGDYFPTSRRKFESTAESIEESLDVESGNEDGFSDDDIECDDDDLIENNCANLNNNDILYGDSDDKVKGSYYGHDSNKLDQSLRSSDEDEAGKTDSNKSRHKPKRKIPSKKPGFHPVSMHSKRPVAPPSGDGVDDSYEESGDNIDMMVAPAFEDSLVLSPTGKRHSIFFENLKSVDMETVAVQTEEEMIPKSELEKFTSSLSVDSSTNTDIIESKGDNSSNTIENISRSDTVDSSTNTDIMESKVDNSCNTVENMTRSDTIDSSTNTDIFEPTGDIENKSLKDMSVSCTIDCSTSTDDLEHTEEGIKSESSVCSVSVSTNTDFEEYQSHEKPESNLGLGDVCNETNYKTESLGLLEGGKISDIDNSFEVGSQKDFNRNKKDFKLKRNNRISDGDENSIEMAKMKPNIGVSTMVLEHNDRFVIPRDGPVRDRIDFHGNDEVLQGTRGQPVGADIETNEKGVESTVAMRQRIFKVVFVGDSGVGKSSFIHRFCNDNFNPTFSATIGVDFQVKSLILGGQSIVLQLWDTAGQERFRSITKQYFRKADGVVIMYDVNSEATYTNVRNWMESVQEGVEEGTVVLLVGNKTDIAESESDRAVKTKDGNKLSVEYDGIFFETSAKMGNNVKESMEAMASILKEKEDKEIEKALHLDDSAAKKKFCCG